MNKISGLIVMVVWVAVAAVAAVPAKNERQPEQKNIDGYTNTPMQPDCKWHVHDPSRPQPKVVKPKYNGKPVKAPKGAKVLFDGSNLDQLTNKGWQIGDDGAMTAAKGGQKSIEKFGDMHLHLEWMVPAGLKGFGQKQGNSGVFLMDRYEIQVLNCWANRTYPDGMTGALYGQTPPLVNACRPAGEWQSYDIHFKAPVFADGKLVSAAFVTVYFNNVLVQDNTEYRGATVWRKVSQYKAHEATAQFSLQYHGNPVRYRNIWVAPLKLKLGK
jgi:hypothetical protein